jgi:superfamily II DNA or RNA helicase
VSPSALPWFRGAIQPVAARDRDILTILALRGDLRISELADLCNAAQVRHTSTRAMGGGALRPILADLVQRGLLTAGRDTWACAPQVRHPILRLAASSGRLAALSRQAGQAGDYAPPRVALSLALYPELAAPGPDTAALLDRAAAQEPDLLAEVVLAALTRPFDPDWLAAIPGPLRTRLTAIALTLAETNGRGLGELYPHLAARIDAEAGAFGPAVLAPLGGIALEMGDVALARRIADRLGTAPQARGLAGSIALVEGRYDEAAELLSFPKKHPTAQTGVASVFQILALYRRGRAEDLESARRLTKAGMAKKSPWRRSHEVLAEVIAAALEPGRAPALHKVVVDLEARDCLAPLLRLMLPLWLTLTDAHAEDALRWALPRVASFEAEELRWLAYQYRRAIEAVVARHPRLAGRAALAPSPLGGPPSGPPLAELRKVTEAWETALDGLARLADAAAAVSLDHEGGDGAERLFFRVFPASLTIEPHLQKRTGKGWTEGRKLAIKHLLQGELVSRLPAEDLPIVAYAREERHEGFGYPEIEHFIDRGAFRELIGHPRVFLEQERAPIEVVEGRVQLAVRSEDAGLVLSLDPPDLKGDLMVRVEAGRLAVYVVEEALRPVVKLVGRGLSIPSAGRSRALDTLGRLARLLPVQSTEQTNARRVPPDARPWLRLAPHRGGLRVTLGVRPLGAEGPELGPGQGAVTLLARVRGEPVQADRDLLAEQRLAAEILAACELEEGGSEDRSWSLDDPEACLALLSALRSLEERVHVEWPHGRPLRLRARLGRRSLRGGIRFESGHFLASGSLAVDDELGLGLGELLSLVGERPGRFVRLAGGDYLELEQELREVLEAIAVVRTGPRRERDPVEIPASAIDLLDRLTAEDSGLTLDLRSMEWRERFLAAFERPHPVPRGLAAELRSYQVEGFVWLARLSELGLGACLADDMGLGKTVQIIALLLHRVKAQLGPALVVAPTSVCDNWAEELTRFAPSLGVRLFLGPGRDRELADLGSNDVLIGSYATLQQDAEKLQAIRWSTAVLDEAQLIKNAESLRARAAFGLPAAMRIAVTGTPVENHIGDLHSIFHFVLPDLLGPWGEFNRRFNASDAEGATGRRATRRVLAPFVLRRTKAQVLEDLPPITEIQRTVTLSAAEAQLYEGIRRSALARLGGALTEPGARVQVLAEITRLRRLCCHPALVAPEAQIGSSKLACFMELMEELGEGHHRALVFSQFVDVLTLAGEMLHEKGISYQYLDGSTPVKQRAAAVAAFQQGEGDAFLISLKAGGFGLNLTAADYVIHLDPWWNPAVEAQARDRAHRIGQSRPVTVYRLVSAGTVEERIVELHRIKRELAESLLEGAEQVATLSAGELLGLLES